MSLCSLCCVVTPVREELVIQGAATEAEQPSGAAVGVFGDSVGSGGQGGILEVGLTERPAG